MLNLRRRRPPGTGNINRKGSCWLPGCWAGSSDYGGDARTEQGSPTPARVVHELEEAEIERQLVLRDAPVRTEPGAQQGPQPFHGVDVHLAEAVAVFVAGILTPGMADR